MAGKADFTEEEWDRLRSAQFVFLPGQLFELRNDIEGDVYGFEGWAAWQVTPAWRLTGGLTTLRKDLTLDPRSNDPQGPDNVTLGNDPEWQWTLRSSIDLGSRQELDIMLRRVAALRVTSHEVDQYTAHRIFIGEQQEALRAQFPDQLATI